MSMTIINFKPTDTSSRTMEGKFKMQHELLVKVVDKVWSSLT